jgi:hypothetical protein
VHTVAFKAEYYSCGHSFWVLNTAKKHGIHGTTNQINLS